LAALSGKWNPDELRGVYILGLLAFYMSARSQLMALLAFAFLKLGVDILTLFLDATMFFWAAYGFLMVFAVSGDLIGSPTCFYIP